MPWQLEEIGAEWDGTWDALAGQAAESGFMQSSAWAAFKRAEGFETHRYGLFDAGELRGGGTLFFYPTGNAERLTIQPQYSSDPPSSTVEYRSAPIASRDEGFLVCPEGPILPWQDLPRAREGLRLLLAAAREQADAHGGLGLRIEPHLPPPRPSLLRNWTRAPIDLTPVYTPILDLTLAEEELRARMHPKGRYNLGLSERHGVRVRRSDQMGDLARFYALFAETAHRDDFFQEPYGFFLNLGAALFPAGQAALFLAEWQEETLAAILVVFFGHRATYLYGGSTSRQRRVMPNYPLHWAALQEARDRGCVEYDLYGYDPFGRADHPYAGISRFKQQFSPLRRDSIGAYDHLFYDRLAEKLIDRLNASSSLGEHSTGPP